MELTDYQVDLLNEVYELLAVLRRSRRTETVELEMTEADQAAYFRYCLEFDVTPNEMVEDAVHAFLGSKDAADTFLGSRHLKFSDDTDETCEGSEEEEDEDDV